MAWQEGKAKKDEKCEKIGDINEKSPDASELFE